MNESEQAQAIVDKNYRYPFNMIPSNLKKLVSNPFEEYTVERIRRTDLIVDSQAQKIVDLQRENVYLKRQHESLSTLMADGAKAFENSIAKKEAKIAEQVKEIDRLSHRSRLLQDIGGCALAINSARKLCGKGPIDPNIDYFAKQLSDFDLEVGT